MSCVEKGPETAGDCTPCSPGIRNRYFRGKLLSVADYDLEQRYMIERRRLLNRTMFGWGVVSGFRIEPGDGEPNGPGGRFAVGAGFALDRHGRELLACDETVLCRPGDFIWLRQVGCALAPCDAPAGDDPAQSDDEACAPLPSDPPDAGDDAAQHAADSDAWGKDDAKEPGTDEDLTGTDDVYVLAAHYAERQVDGVLVQGGCGDDVCETNRLCETVVFSLTPRKDFPLCPQSCPPPRFPCEPDDWRKWEIPPKRLYPFEPAKVGDRGPHLTLAEWSMERGDKEPPCTKGKLCPLNAGLSFDPEAGVPLALVTLGYHCRRPYVARVEDSRGPRRLARPNDTLFDLIRGCDLTRIKDIGWKHLLQRQPDVDFEAFEDMFLDGKPAQNPEPVNTEFWVLFSGPVWIGSLSPSAITISLFHWDSGEGVRFLRRVPVVGFQIARWRRGDPTGSTRGFRVIVHGSFWQEEIFSHASAFNEQPGTIVELCVRGGMIVDVHGQLIAAGGGYLPTRPGWPGSDFISAFTVRAPAPKPAASKRRSSR